jgi:hypothetical protein
VLAKSCRISSATPILAPALGFAGVGLTAAAVGQAAIFTQQRFERDRFAGQRLAGKQRQQTPQLWQPEDLVLDAMVGLLLFKVHIALAIPCDKTNKGSGSHFLLTFDPNPVILKMEMRCVICQTKWCGVTDVRWTFQEHTAK